MCRVYIPSEGYSLQKEIGFKSEDNFSTEKNRFDKVKLSEVWLLHRKTSGNFLVGIVVPGKE